MRCIEVGSSLGEWTVLEELPKDKWNKRSYLCRCSCGNEKRVLRSNLLFSKSTKCKSCAGTLNRTTHGLVTHELYSTWQTMKTRCYNSNREDYKYYGGRGITVVDEWLNSFSQFLKDMGERPINTTLDREDVNGPYSKENCRWVTWDVQVLNKRKVA